MNRHAGASWLGRAEVLLVDAVHLREVVHGGQENSHLHNTSKRASSRLQDVLHALTADGGLLSNGTLDQVALSICWDLPADEDVGASLDGLGVWSDRLCRLWSADELDFSHCAGLLWWCCVVLEEGSPDGEDC